MNIASRNIQEKYEENLWIWPSETYDLGWTGDQSKLISIKPQTWQRWCGGLGGNGSNLVVRNLTDHSVEVQDVSGYRGGVFVDLPVGDYTLCFNVDIDSNLYECTYINCENDKWRFVGGKVFDVVKGMNSHIFHINDGFYTRFDFGKRYAGWTKLTDISIREI